MWNQHLDYFMLRVCIFSLLCSVVLTQECELQIWREDTQEQIETADLCERQYNTQDCINFIQTFNRSDLPMGYPQDGYSVETPADIDIVAYRSLWKNFIYTGLSFRWQAPFSGHGRASSEGYLLTWDVEGKTKNATACRIFHFNSRSDVRKLKLTFHFNIDYAYGSSSYSVKVYSMPPPTAGSQDDTRTFVKMFATTPYPYRRDGGPGNWAPSIAFKTKSNGTVIVEFTLSPPEFNLTAFEIHLVNSSNPKTSMRFFNYTGKVYSRSAPHGSHSFHNLPSGKYQILVWVIDPYRGQVDKCLCWIKESTGKHCNNICGSTVTQWFLLNVTEPPMSAPSLSSDETTLNQHRDLTTLVEDWRGTSATIMGPFATIISAQSREQVPTDTAESTTFIIWVQVGSIALVALCIILLFIGWKRCHSVTSAVPHLAEKTLYVLAVDDHKAHTHSVECLVKLFQMHCCCKVIYPPWDYTQKMGSYEWFHANIAKCDYVLFIDSVAAEKLILAHLCKKTYRSQKLSTEKDLFITGLKHIMNDQEMTGRENTLVVSFGGRSCQKYLHAPRIYELLDQLPQLLCKIHDLNTSDKAYSKYWPLSDITQVDESSKLLSAIAAAKAYEASNPNWFEDNFGTLTPILHQSISVMSGDSAYRSLLPDRTLSVSSQDLSDIESPSSDLNHPRFAPSVTSSDPLALPYQYEVLCDHNSHYWQQEMRLQEQSKPSKVLSGDKDFSIVSIGTNILDGSLTEDRKASTCPPLSVYTIESNPVDSSDAAHYPAANSLSENRRKELKILNGCSTIVPPESVSEIVFDSFSTAMREVNSLTQ